MKTNRYPFLLLCILVFACQKDIVENFKDEQDLTVQTKAFSVNDPCGSQENWDWTKLESFDYAYISGLGRINISNPFLSNTSSDPRITNIINAKDYLPSQGWVLLAKTFGCSVNYMQTAYPYFMLYNKYTGIIRLLVFNGKQIDYKKAVVTLSWDNDTDKTSLFSPSEVYQSANEEYHTGNKRSGTIVNYVMHYYSDAWFITEMPVTFDPLVNYQDYFGLRFKIANEVTSTVNLESQFQFETKTKTITINASNSSSNSNGYSLLKDGQKYLSVIPTTDALDKYYKNIEKGLDPAKYEGHKKLQAAVKNMNKSFNDGSFKKTLSSIAAASSFLNGTLGAGISILSNFLGKSNSQAIPQVQIMPTISNGTGTIKGDIVIVTNATSFNLQLPGSNHSYGSSTRDNINFNGLPVYDKPLGVISLNKTPRLGAKSQNLYTSYYYAFDQYSGDVSYSIEEYSYITYQMTDNINLALNTNSGTAIIGIKARFMAKHNAKYITNKDNLDKKWKTTYITERIEKGSYELLENTDSYFIYGTPLVDISQFKNTELLVFDRILGDIGLGFVPYDIFNNPIYLQLMIALKPTDTKADQTPIIHNVTYCLDRNKTMPWSTAGKSNALVLTKY